ncbi:2-C-methyl-D-erythritol 4-phosphate cytidylyltransferase [Lawsonella clevelandensis]|uniref:2-C-methyl-D-erythritol 4-phosphate cytidylyltransferase n=1 Tax=Lawsonella clevelandensis TaxID=1528099 RepID=A0A0M4M8P7_9ACTN|nr:2-C-methyl-D-erythritol 4-phosphate cytidylyltransferase [Lawsonella clevelandensis]ALE19201.1 hypothetical protein AL705_05990 [Lawsonella clevelandensis]ALE34861.1 hypothetical protein IY73_05930 [Lawsonella clevelandensis]MDU7193292.1 2-C-methyl-D-erythritol 4-phosphate cytidylyltransferase [Lawsonella clevelandensis]VHO01142.1 2-C-methyl-D-erythritol 4-phosphate cytidylyltransferase [Lawsonella clevelandensis]
MVESASSRKDGKVVAIVAAAGAGHRLGADRPKAFVRVGDYTLLQHTLRRIDASTAVDEIIIMASFEMCATAQEQARELSLSTPMRVFPGGVLRSDSIYEGLKYLMRDDADETVGIVLIHDAARCFAPTELFTEVTEKVRALMAEDIAAGVIPVLPMVDTVKMVDSADNVLGTPDRTRLRRVQTPQGFDAKLLWTVHQAAKDEELTTTDDATLLEKYQLGVATVPGSEEAFKITTPTDLRLAQLLADEECEG